MDIRAPAQGTRFLREGGLGEGQGVPVRQGRDGGLVGHPRGPGEGVFVGVPAGQGRHQHRVRFRQGGVRLPRGQDEGLPGVDECGHAVLDRHQQPAEEGPGPEHPVGGQAFGAVQGLPGVLDGPHQHQPALGPGHGHVEDPHLLLHLLPPVQEQHAPAGQGLPLDAVPVHEVQAHAQLPMEEQRRVLALPAELAVELRQEHHREFEALGLVYGQDADHVALDGLGGPQLGGVPGVVHILQKSMEAEAAGEVVAPGLADQGVQIGLALDAAGHGPHLHVQLRLVQQPGQELLQIDDHALPPPSFDPAQEPGRLALRVLRRGGQKAVQQLALGAAGPKVDQLLVGEAAHAGPEHG